MGRSSAVKTILLIGAFDTKGEEYHFIRKLIQSQGCQVLTMNWGVLGGTNLFPIDVDSAEVARAGGGDLNQLRQKKDQPKAMEVMSKGATILAEKLFREGKFEAVLGLGRARGTGVATSAMRALPIGVPKVVVSTVAAGDISPYVGVKDINLFPSVVDISGLNRISETIFKQAVGAICGMVKMDYQPAGEKKPTIAITLFGQTKPCVDRCREAFVGRGFEVLVFHATGIGGKTMEAMVQDGYIQAVLDITPTEVADALYGGIFSAGPERLEAPGRMGIPHLIIPGCVDMVNFGPPESVPPKYRNRLLFESKPTVTIMRTNVEENSEMGLIFARKANAARGKIAFLIPKKGVSRIDAEGEIFWWPEADRAFLEALKKNLNPSIPVVEMDGHINDEPFAQKAVEMLMELMDQK